MSDIKLKQCDCTAYCGDDPDLKKGLAQACGRAEEIKSAVAKFNFHDHLVRQAKFSLETFGPGARSKGVVDHIRKELCEIEADPSDLKEWIDVIILALDGAWRTGATPQQIIDAIVAKQDKNEGRVWPDWRTADPDKAIEHDRRHDGFGSLQAPKVTSVVIERDSEPNVMAAAIKRNLLTFARIAQLYPNEHTDDICVDCFALEMKIKLDKSRMKGREGWERCSADELSKMLREHVDKGDPVDVANFCMFLKTLGQPIGPAAKDD